MITEIPLEDFVQDKTNIYYYIYLPNHELATKSGKVYMHRYIMAKHLGRHLTSNEAVHHIDEDRTNNDLNNLELMSISDHATLHQEEKHGPPREVYCAVCSKRFTVGSGRFKQSISGNFYCGDLCRIKGNREFEVDAELLGDLVWSIPTVDVAKMFNVSDVAVAKRCKILGVVKPPRGYWRKVQTGTLGKEPKPKGKSCFKLTKEQADYILANFIANHRKFGARALGRMFNVGHDAVMAVVNGTRGSKYAESV